MSEQNVPSQPTKAKIVSVDDSSEMIECHFNPEQMILGRTVNWKFPDNIGRDLPKPIFKGGQASDITIELWFDTTDPPLDGSGNPVSGWKDDVREHYKLLLKMTRKDDQNKDPGPVRFEWGKFLSFTAIITNVTQTFTMFQSDGTPVRAKVNVTLKEVPDEPTTQNPTSRSQPRKIWVVREGETLDWIAYREYGSSAYWRHIAETNDLANPRDLQPGQVLRLVAL
jgi:LysM repeat protein